MEIIYKKVRRSL